MKFSQVIAARKSIRSYLPQPVEREKLQVVLKAAVRAPSAGNLQAFQIYVVRNDVLKGRLAAAAMGQPFVATAPVILVACADQGRADRVAKGGEVRYSAQDAVIALAYAQLAATEQGLASCWIGALDEAAVSRTLKLPRTLKPIALLPVGYAAEKARVSPRRPLSELVVDLGD